MWEYIVRICRRLLVFTVFALLVGYASEARANTFAVNSTADVVDASPGDGKCETGRDVPGGTSPVKECTLRAAVQESNALAGEHEVLLPAGTYLLTQPTFCSFNILETTSTQTETSITLCLTGKMRIIGAGAGSTFIDAARLNRVAFLDSRAVVELRGLTVRRGSVSSTQVFVIGGGGGIHNRGRLTLTDTVVSENITNSVGGGIHNVGTLKLERSTIIGNTAVLNSGFGGGLFNGGASGSSFCDLNPCDVTVNDSLITGNGSNSGGGIGMWDGTIKTTNSTISDNTSTNGGGILNLSGNLTLVNSTVSNNSATIGGGLSVDQFGEVPQTTLNNVTITRNKGRQNGAGIRVAKDVVLRNTLIAGNINENASPTSGTFDCETHFSALVSQGHNLIQDTRGCAITGDTTGNITGQDPLLGVLTNNGGLTPTHALLAGSPALDAGSPNAPGSGGAACATADQRALLRPIGQRCDIGAFEHKGGFSVSGALPNRGGNGGSLAALISGSGFTEGTEVRLRRVGQPDIIGSPPTVDAAGFALATSFDLNGKATGAWDVVVTNPDGSARTLVGGFTVEEVRAPQLWSEIVGRSALRPGVPAEYAVMYGNRGNVDATGVPLAISAPSNFRIAVYFEIAPPPPQTGQVQTDWSRAPVTILAGADRTNVLLLLPVVPAGFTGYVRFRLTLPPESQHGDSFVLSAFLGDPYFNPGPDPEVLDGLIAGARSYAAQHLGVTLPPSLDPELRLYATRQLEGVAAGGRQSLIESLGTGTEVYGLAHLTIDLARFGSARAAAGSTSSVLTLLSSLFGSPHSVPPDAAVNGGQTGCAGGTLLPGQLCNEKPPTLPPTPDPNASPTPFTLPTPPPPIPPGECNQIPKHHVSSDGMWCLPDDRKGCGVIPVFGTITGGSADCTIIPIRNSVDPNDKTGSVGVGEGRFRQTTAPFNYTVFFENLPTATAAAQTVTITDQLDTASLDLDTFSLGPISFGGYTVTPPPGQSSFVSALDLRPESDLLVKIDAHLNPVTGVVTWQFTSLDPDTQQLTEDPDAGFLPPNTSPPAGEGKVLFTVSPKKGLATGAATCNEARIVFDVNAPIDTPRWCNTFDDAKPTSSVQPLARAVTDANFLVRWAGADPHSGVNDYTVYVSDNGGPFIPWLTQTEATEATYPGVVGHSYSFFSVAHDRAGNAEGLKAAGEATTFVTTPACPNPIDCSEFFVRQHYRDFLGREPDPAGLAFWTNEIEQCGADPQCREVKRINVSAAFYLSIEFQETGYLAYRMYKSAYGDATSPNVPGTVPVIRRQDFLSDAQAIGQGVQVGVGDWQQQLEANKNAFALEFVSRPRFTADYPAAMTAAEFVARLDQRAGGVLADGERAELVALLGVTPADAQRRAQVLRRVAEDADLHRAEFNRAFVLMQYFGYLRRNPDDPQDTDYRGWKFWLDKLEEFDGNFVRAEMVKAFISSIEYRQRFGQ